MQQQMPVIPKSAKKERLQENAEIFDFQLSDEDIKLIDNLNKGYTVVNTREYWKGFALYV